VLDLSRIESGNFQLSPEPVDVGELVRDCVSLVAPMAARRGIDIRLGPGAGELHATADRQRLKQALINVLSNAVKYNVEGGRVRVTCAGEGGRVRIRVSDTGPGIPEAKREKLFLPF